MVGVRLSVGILLLTLGMLQSLDCDFGRVSLCRPQRSSCRLSSGIGCWSESGCVMDIRLRRLCPHEDGFSSDSLNAVF